MQTAGETVLGTKFSDFPNTVPSVTLAERFFNNGETRYKCQSSTAHAFPRTREVEEKELPG